MDIKMTNMKIAEKQELNPINIEILSEPKKLLGINSKFKTMYFSFEEGKGLPDHIHNGYASVFVYEGKVEIKFTTGEQFMLDKGSYLAFDARIKHNVIAQVKSKVLVNISAALN